MPLHPDKQNPGHLRGRGLGRAPPVGGGPLLDRDGLTAALAVPHVEGDLFALLDILAACALQDGGVQEDVLATIVRGHEAEAADLVEPLDGAVHGVGRATLVAAEVAARRRTVAKATATRSAEAAARGTAEAAATGRAEAATAAEATTATPEIPTRGTVAEATAATTEVPTRRTVAEATAAATEVTARGTVAEATAGAIATTAGRTATRALDETHDARDQAPTLAVRPDLAVQLVAGFRRLDSGFREGGSVEENVLAIGTEDEAEPLAGVVPLHLGLNRAGPTLVVVGKHVGYLSANKGHDPTRCRAAEGEDDIGPP